MTPPKNLTWIHLSDLHFGHGADAKTRFDQQAVTAAIVRDVEEVRATLGPPDWVFLTGDIAFAAAAEEYKQAGTWLAKLLGAAKVEPERLLLVPGNHDVHRKKAVEGAGDLTHEGLRARWEKVNELLENEAKMKAIWPKLEGYQTFARKYGSPKLTAARPYWTKSLATPLGEVFAIGLNTTLLSFDKSDAPDTLALGLGQIHKALEEVPRNALLFIFQHHPPHWLCDGKELQALLQYHPHLLFCGHVHEQQGFVRLPFTDRGALELVAGAGHQDAGEAGEHAYAWGRLHRDALEYFPRSYDASRKRFFDQRVNPPAEQKRYHERLGQYVIVPRGKLPDALDQWLRESGAEAPSPSPTDAVATFRAPQSETTASATVGPAPYDPAKPYFFVPHRPKGERVIGREDALRKIRAQLEAGRPTAIGQTAAFVGLGGLGKTQLAVEYAHQFRESYPGGVYWLNADEPLDGQLTRLAIEAKWVSPLSDPKTQLEIAERRIRCHSDCLIIFDNVERFEAIGSLLPEPTARLHLLLTSRTPQPRFESVDIDRLDEEQSLSMLCSESGRSIESPDEREVARRLLQPLDGLPLAIELAGAYLRRYARISLGDYANLLERKGIEAEGLCAQRYGESYTRHEAGLLATLRISESVFDETPLLRDVLDLLAWSGSASMSRDLIRAVLAVEEPAHLDAALSAAETLRILKEEASAKGTGPRFQMHRLVREARRLEIPLENEPARWIPFVERLGDWFQAKRDDFAHMPVFEAELDHLHAWREHTERLGHIKAMLRLLWLSAYPPYYRGQYNVAMELVQKVLKTFEQSGIEDAELEANLHNDLGSTLRDSGDYKSAIAHTEKALGIRNRIWGKMHPDTARSNGNVGLLYCQIGDCGKALEYLQRAFDVQCSVLGPKHRDTATTLSNMGLVHHKLKDHPKALDCHQSTLEITRNIWRERHPDIAVSLNNIGVTYQDMGYHDKALECYLYAFEVDRDTLGERHPATATSLNNIGHALSGLGKSVDALRRFQLALKIRRETLGEAHPDTIQSRTDIARLFIKLHRNVEALSLVEQGLKAVPNNVALRKLKAQIQGKPSPKAPRVSSSKLPKPRRKK